MRQSMSSFLHKIGLHILILGSIVSFILIAPEVHTHFIVNEGKPVGMPPLPPEISQVQFNIEELSLYDAINGVYRLSGWAFLTIDKNIPPEEYEQQIVLTSDFKNYAFYAKPVYRHDVKAKYENLGMRLDMAGLFAYLAKGTVHPGTYNLGIIFKHKIKNSIYYVNTRRCITRTPNHFYLEEPDSLNCISSIDKLIGEPIYINATLPPEISEVRYNLEKLNAYNERVYQLIGWAFPEMDSTASAMDYELQIVITSGVSNYIFAASALPRPDVEVYFANNPMDLTMSGFIALISQDYLTPDTYDIGLIFRRVVSEADYYFRTHYCLRRTADGLVLEEATSTVCRSISTSRR